MDEYLMSDMAPGDVMLVVDGSGWKNGDIVQRLPGRYGYVRFGDVDISDADGHAAAHTTILRVPREAIEKAADLMRKAAEEAAKPKVRPWKDKDEIWEHVNEIAVDTYGIKWRIDGPSKQLDTEQLLVVVRRCAHLETMWLFPTDILDWTLPDGSPCGVVEE